MIVKKVFYVPLSVTKPPNCNQFDDFYKDLTILVKNINDPKPPCSVIVGNLKVKCSNWSPFDKNNAGGKTSTDSFDNFRLQSA